MSIRSREIRLKSRPVGLPSDETFELAEVDIADPGPGQVRVRNIWMSVDPYMRGRMIGLTNSYVPPFEIGRPLEGGCIGQVVESEDPSLARGDYVLGTLGWREWYVADARSLLRVDPGVAPIQTRLGTLGMPGMTAWVGLLRIARLKEGETVFVSGAAGAVGMVACQIARAKGCRVVASAGAAEKVDWLRRVARVEVAFDYKKVRSVDEALATAAPEGIDVAFDNVGGEHLEAALAHMRPFGRIVLCGMIAQYNATEPPPGPRTLLQAIAKRVRLEGFIVSDHLAERAQFLEDLSKWIADGRIRWKETVLEGLENAPRAFVGLFRGESFGKMLVRVGPDREV